MPKLWWNTYHTLGTYHHTLGSSADLPKSELVQALYYVIHTDLYFINYIIVLVEAVFVAPRSEELGIAT